MSINIKKIFPADFLIFAGIYFLLTWWADTSVCIIRAFTGYPCPGCGLTTAAMQILAGDFYGALHTNAMIFALPFLLLIFIINRRFYPANYPRLTIIFSLTAALAMIVYFIIRLVIYYPDAAYPLNRAENTIPVFLWDKFMQ